MKNYTIINKGRNGLIKVYIDENGKTYREHDMIVGNVADVAKIYNEYEVISMKYYEKINSVKVVYLVETEEDD